MSDNNKLSKSVGRGAVTNPPSRFDRLHLVDEVDGDDLVELPKGRLPTQFIVDDAQSIISENNSPDLEFRYSLNPYRGCEHGCSYCYARTYHEYLGYSGGLDFETKIVYKPNGAELFRKWLSRPKYQPEQVTLSGATDCYQPAERRFELTRACLATALEFRQPISIVTKNALVLRDLDLITEMAAHGLIRVNISITSLDQNLTKILEPRTSSPSARLRALSELVSARVPTRALLSPVIPGLNDTEIPSVLKAVSEVGGDVFSKYALASSGRSPRCFLELDAGELTQ